MGRRADGGSGGEHESDHDQLGAGGNQHHCQRYILFQRSRLDELSGPILPPTLFAVRRGKSGGRES